MRILKLTLALSVCAALLSSCSREPKSCFTIQVKNPEGGWITTTTGKVGEDFYFSPICSENAYGKGTLFEYGDGTKGIEESHVYAKPGSYTVKCTVYSVSHGEKGEKTDVASQSVTVKPAPTAMN
jgi:PKD repeat protein